MATTSARRATDADRGRSWRALVLLVLGCEAAGLIGVPFTARSSDSWYEHLAKASYNPPSWVFGPVWTVLYAVMGLAAWIVWRREHPRRTVALAVFGAQLLLNVAWSPIFFGAQAPGWALADITALWLLVVVTVRSFWSVDVRAGLLLVPYLAWVSFAALLNAEIVRLN